MRDAKRLAQRIGAELRVYTVASETDALLPRIEAAAPACPMTAVEASSWDRLQRTLFEEIQPDDMMLFPSDRRSGLMWTPALDHFPEALVERFPQVNLLVAYPSLPTLDRESGREPETQGEMFPRLLPVELGSEQSLEQALQRLAASAFPDNPATAREAVRRLQEAAQAYPVELTAGTVLLHARCGHLDKPWMMVCHAPEGWPMPNLPTPPRIILALLGAQTLLPEQHLKTLSLVARRMHEPGMEEAFRSARHATTLCELFAGAARGGG
jgi:mannitol/fructose-specific phosphotransferase system IIA component (Ntr-type)